MRSGLTLEKIPGFIVILVLLLEGCGHKGPLKLPEPQSQSSQPQASQSQLSNPQIPGSQEPGLPSSQQAK